MKNCKNPTRTRPSDHGVPTFLPTVRKWYFTENCPQLNGNPDLRSLTTFFSNLTMPGVCLWAILESNDVACGVSSADQRPPARSRWLVEQMNFYGAFDALICNGFNVEIVSADGIFMLATHTAYGQENGHNGEERMHLNLNHARVNKNKTGVTRLWENEISVAAYHLDVDGHCSQWLSKYTGTCLQMLSCQIWELFYQGKGELSCWGSREIILI